MLAMTGKYCAGDAALFTRFRQSFERRIIELLTVESNVAKEGKPRLIRTIETKDIIEKGFISAISTSGREGGGAAGIAVQALVESVSLACFKALTLPC